MDHRRAGNTNEHGVGGPSSLEVRKPSRLFGTPSPEAVQVVRILACLTVKVRY